MDAGVFVTLARIAPVEHEHAAVRTVTQLHPAEPRIGRNEEVGCVPADVAASIAFEDFLICPAAMEVQREESATTFGRPVVALVNHHANVRVTATERVGLAVTRLLPLLGGIEVPMIR